MIRRSVPPRSLRRILVTSTCISELRAKDNPATYLLYRAVWGLRGRPAVWDSRCGWGGGWRGDKFGNKLLRHEELVNYPCLIGGSARNDVPSAEWSGRRLSPVRRVKRRLSPARGGEWEEVVPSVEGSGRRLSPARRGVGGGCPQRGGEWEEVVPSTEGNGRLGG